MILDRLKALSAKWHEAADRGAEYFSGASRQQRRDAGELDAIIAELERQPPETAPDGKA